MEKRFYKISELVEMGFSHYELMCACHIAGQRFATRSTNKPRSVWKIDLQEYLKFRQQLSKPADNKKPSDLQNQRA